MLTSQMIFFIRFLKRNKKAALLNLIGLTIGLAAFIYILDYTTFEKSFDNYHQNRDRIFRVTSQKIQDGISNPGKASASAALAPFLSDFTQIERVARVHIFDNERHIVTITDSEGNQRKFEERNGFHAEEQYFQIFSDQLLAGNPRTCLANPFNIVITASLAEKYFPGEQALGRTIGLMDEDLRQYIITGIVKDRPANSHFQYDYLVSLKTMQTLWSRARWNSWDWDYFHTYIKVKPGIDPHELESQINLRVAEQGRETFTQRNYKMGYSLQRLSDIHLHSDLDRELSINGDGDSVKYLLIIGVLVLLIAYVNYINIVTAAATDRAKEIGIKKVSGASRNLITSQLLLEAIFMSSLAFIFSLLVLFITKSYLVKVTGYEFQGLILQKFDILAVTLLAVVMGGLLSGYYPAYILSNFKLTNILKGSFKSSQQGLLLRKWLVMFQFTASILLISGTLGVFSQISFLQNRDLGINLEEIIAVHTPNERTENYWNEYDYLRQKVNDRTDIQYMTASNQIPGNVLYHVELYKKRNQHLSEAKILKHIWVDYDYTSLYDLKLLAGRMFDPHIIGDERSLLLNASAAKLLGFDDPMDAIDQSVTWVHSYGALDEMKCIGIVKDFDQEALGATEPMAFLMNRHFRWLEMGYMLFKTSTQDMDQTLAFLEEEFEKLYPGDSFSYYFLNDRFSQQYEERMNFGKIFSLFALLAIAIATLGLFGLISYLVQQRRKEVSIRKVLGAREIQITALFLNSFSYQLIWSIALALPIAYVILSRWLETFSYQVQLAPLIFVVPAIAILILFLIVSVIQTRSIVQQNPVKFLRNE